MSLVEQYNYVEEGSWLVQFLKSSGSPDMNINGSSTPVVFRYTVPAGWSALIHRLNFVMIDNAAMNGHEFGGIGGGLTNGLLIRLENPDNSERRDLLDGVTIKRNGDFATFAGVDVVHAGGNRGLGIRWTWSKATGGVPILLRSGQSVAIEVQDDIRGLLRFNAGVQGLLVGNERL